MRHLGRIHFIAAQDADGVKRLQGKHHIADQRVGYIELNRFRMKVGGNQAHEVAFGRGLRQQVLIGAKDIAQLHAVPERKLTRPHDMALHIDSALAIGKNCCDMNTIAILHIEGGNLSLDRLGSCRMAWTPGLPSRVACWGRCGQS